MTKANTPTIVVLGALLLDRIAAVRTSVGRYFDKSACVGVWGSDDVSGRTLADTIDDVGKAMGATPPAWGLATMLDVYRDPHGGWEFSDWYDIVLPNAEGGFHHGHSSGSTLPDTVVVCCEGRRVALADAFSFLLENQYCWDAEYYLVLRLRTILESEAWRQLPWASIGPGEAFVAWDKFHGLEYSRLPGESPEMSYGGDWIDLQSWVDAEDPPADSPPPLLHVSDATLLRAIRHNDGALVQQLLDAGANPEAGYPVPTAAVRSVSVDRNSYALLDAVQQQSTVIVAALLAAGAHVNGPPETTLSPLRAALANPPSDASREIVAMLRRHGATTPENSTMD